MNFAKASFVCLLIFTVGFGVLFYADTGPIDDYSASEAQGFLWFSLAAVASIVSIIGIFPVTAKIMLTSEAFSTRQWLFRVWLGNAVICLLLSILTHFYFSGGLGISGVAILTLFIFTISIVILIPFYWVWLKVADVSI